MTSDFLRMEKPSRKIWGYTIEKRRYNNEKKKRKKIDETRQESGRNEVDERTKKAFVESSGILGF